MTENTKTKPQNEEESTPKEASVESSFLNGLINQSGKIDKLATALAKAQAEMEGAKTASKNPFFKSSYADLHAVMTSSLPYLNKQGLSIVQGNRYGSDNGFYVTTTLLHQSGQWMRSEIRMPIGGKRDAQAVGAAMTYGRRYGLSAMIGIAQYDDDGNAGSAKEKELIKKGIKAEEDAKKVKTKAYTPVSVPNRVSTSVTVDARTLKDEPVVIDVVEQSNNQIIDGGTV